MMYHQKSEAKGSAVQPYQVWLQMVQQFSHTKSGYKWFSSSEDIIQTTTEILNIYYDLDLEYSNPKVSLDILVYTYLPSN